MVLHTSIYDAAEMLAWKTDAGGLRPSMTLGEWVPLVEQANTLLSWLGEGRPSRWRSFATKREREAGEGTERTFSMRKLSPTAVRE